MGTYSRIGFLADTHSNKNDGSDLPDAVLAAFSKAEVDVIVHLGDIGRKGILDRLREVAPVLVPVGDNKSYVPPGIDDPAQAVRTIVTAGGSTVGLWFNLAQPDKKIEVPMDGGPIAYAEGALPALLQRRFKTGVDVVAFGGTHVGASFTKDGVLFVNPGSPTLPSDGMPSVAVLDGSEKSPKASLVRL
jgi:putative phosphoesterase